MANDLTIQGEVVVTSEKAEGAFDRVGRKADAMAKEVESSAGKAGRAVDGIGTGSERGAATFTRSQARMRDEILRSTRALENLGKTASQRMEAKLELKGFDRAQFQPFLDDLRKAEEATKRVESGMLGMGSAATVAGQALAALGLGLAAGEFVRMADASTNVRSRLSLVTASAAELASVQERLFQTAQDSRVSFVDLVGTYTQVARSTKELGVSQTALLGVIRTISQAVTISGGSAASAEAALTQLSQGFAAGALRGEELNSVLEQTPRLAQALADGLGVGVGELRELGQAGELTSERVLGALERAAASVASEFSKMTVTVEQASTTATNSLIRLSGAFDRLLGVTSVIAGTITALSQGIDTLAGDLEKLGSQGPLRKAADEVLELDRRARLLRSSMEAGIYGPKFQAELDAVNAKLEIAKMRFRELDQQLGGTNPRDQSGFAGRGSSYANEAARQAQLREDANAFRLNQAGVPTGYLKDMAELIRLNQAGVIVGKEYADALKRQQDEILKKTGVVKSSASAMGQEQKAYESLLASLSEKIKLQDIEAASGEKATESQRLRLQVEQDYTGAKRQALLLLVQEIAAREKAQKSQREEAAQVADAARSYTELVASRQKAVADVEAQVRAEREAAEAIGLTRRQIADLEIAKLEESAASKERRADYLDSIDLSKQAGDEYREEAKALRELAAAKGRTATRQESVDAAEAASDAAKKAAEDWQRYTEDINSSLTDALLRGFEDGKGFAENFRDTVKNMFATLVLRPVISAVLSPASNAIGSVLGTGSVSGGLGGAASALGSLSNIGSLGGIGSALGGFGAAAGYGTQALLAGNGFGAIGGGLNMIGAGSLAQGAGMIAGVVGPVAVGIAALTSLLGSFKGERRFGGQYAYSVDGRTLYDPQARTNVAAGMQGANYLYGPSGGEVGRSEVTTAINATVQGINDLLRGVGSSASVAGFQAGLETSDKGRGGVFAGGRLTGGATFGESGYGSNYAGTLFELTSSRSLNAEDAIAAFSLDLKQVTIQALQAATDIPKSIAEQLTGVNAEALTDEAATQLLTSISAQVQAVNGLREAVDLLPFQNLRDLGFDAAAGLIEFAGGLDALSQNLSGYFQNYYSEAERTTIATANVSKAMAALGITMPDLSQSGEDARAQFRALVDGIDVSTEAGQRQFAGLLALQGAFAELTPIIDTTAEAARVAASALQQRQQLEMQLLQAQGNTDEIRRRQLADLLNDENRAIQQAIFDLQDKQAADAAAQAAQDAADRVKEAWKSVGDALVDEVKRILGEIAGTGAQGLDFAQAQFAIATGQARAGDQAAATSLPGLSRTVLELAQQNASSASDLKVFQAQIAASLMETTRQIGSSMGFYVPNIAGNGGDMVVSPPSGALSAGAMAVPSNDRLEGLVTQLVQDNRTQAGEIARLNLRMAKLLEKWDVDGLPLAA